MGSHRDPGVDPLGRDRPHRERAFGRDPDGSPPPEGASADGLAETKVDLEAQEDEAAAEEVDLTAAYDRPDRTDDASLKRFDPEAGKMGIAVKLRAVRQRVDTPFGRMVIAIPILLASVALGIFAFAFPTWPIITAAGLLVPASAWLLWWRYQQWLGHKRYMFRLLETLGEDVSDWSMDQQYKKTRIRRAKR